MAPADLTTEQWEVTVDSIEKSIDILFVFFEDMIKNPDPRVKWAMQIMDQEGEVCTNFYKDNEKCAFVQCKQARNLRRCAI